MEGCIQAAFQSSCKLRTRTHVRTHCCLCNATCLFCSNMYSCKGVLTETWQLMQCQWTDTWQLGWAWASPTQHIVCTHGGYPYPCLSLSECVCTCKHACMIHVTNVIKLAPTHNAPLSPLDCLTSEWDLWSTTSVVLSKCDITTFSPTICPSLYKSMRNLLLFSLAFLGKTRHRITLQNQMKQLCSCTIAKSCVCASV